MRRVIPSIASDTKKQALAGEANDAGDTGLYAVFAPTDVWEKTQWSVKWRADAKGRSVKFQIVTLGWDGKSFNVSVKPGQLAWNAKESQL
jgi:hypothetical protein